MFSAGIIIIHVLVCFSLQLKDALVGGLTIVTHW